MFGRTQRIDNLTDRMKQEDARVDVRPRLDLVVYVGQKILCEGGAVERCKHQFKIVDVGEQIGERHAPAGIEIGVIALHALHDQQTGDAVLDLPG